MLRHLFSPFASMRLFSLEGKLALLLGAATLLAVAVALLLRQWFGNLYLAALLTPLFLLPLCAAVAHQLTQPIAALMRALEGSVVSFRDGDFSFSINDRRQDELGDLVRAHNELGRVLRDERQGLFQRELMLDTVVQNTPTALALTDAHDHVIYANLAARQLLNGGRELRGLDFARVVAESPAAFAQAVAEGGDRLFTVMLDKEEETFHLSMRQFKLQGRVHHLHLIRRLTRELSRQEVATWKKVIRVISHELNNSLAPISSLAHSGRVLAGKGDASRLGTVFDTIEDRARHLHGFIRGYAEFARLPHPRPERVVWDQFLEGLGRHSAFHLAGKRPVHDGWFDRAQLEQVLINLLKNAHESGGAPEGVELEVLRRGEELRVEVRDRGTGMSETVLSNALLPFYSTKRSGTGLGLALAREIVEAHGGRVVLANREGGGLGVTLVLPGAWVAAEAPTDPML